MLINLGEVSESNSTLDRPYLGIVVNNVDPFNQGRVKCTIVGLIEDPTKAPWIIRGSNSFLGGNKTTGQFSVPEVGSELKIEFPYLDIYSAEYTGFWNGSNTTTSEAGSPSKVVFAHIENLKVNYDKITQALEIEHPSGSTVTLKANGDVVIKATKDIILNGQEGRVLTTATDPVIDLITGAPSVGVAKVKAGVIP